MTNLLGLIGSKGSGKTTLSNQLIAFDWSTTSLATPIKSMIQELLFYQDIPDKIIHRMIYGDLKETPTKYLGDQSPRHCMQTLGTEWRDLINKNLWLDIWEKTVDLENEKIIIDDVRYIHEAERIRQLGGKIILINRLSTHNFDPHPSEQEYVKITPDLTIYNDSTPENMLQQLKTYLGENL